MGLSLSCLHYGPLHERLLAFFWNLADSNRGNSNVSGQTPILRALGSGKMLIERSLSLKRMEGDKKEHLSRRASLKSSEYDSPEMVLEPTTPQPSSPKHEAAIKLQKVYKSFRTRRQLADCAVLVEQRWWKLLDFALLKRSSVSFFDHGRPETVVSRWSRARMRAAKVGKGLSKDAKAQKLALQHWLEAIDPRHRYGHNLHFYYRSWLECESKQPFFYWLDVGEGKEVNLQHCPRSKLQQQCIKYLGPKEREAYEVIVEDGRLINKQNRQLLDTSSGSPGLKWIFVLSTSKDLYVGQKKKGVFQHSSFLAGGATSSAGRLVVEKGILKAVWPHSGHYRPTEENFQEFVSFLAENNVDLSDVKKSPMGDEESWCRSESSSPLRRILSRKMSLKHLRTVSYDKIDSEQPSEVQPPHVYDGQENDLGPVCDKPTKSFAAGSQDSERICGDFIAVDIQNVYKGSEGETDEDIDDNGGGTECGEGSDSANTAEEARHLPEAALNGNEELEAQTSLRQHYMFHKKNLFEEDHDEDGQQHIPKELLLQRINSTKRTKSLQLGRQWSSGVGPRIGCVRDYPAQLQFRALEQVNLSPRTTKHLLSTCSTPRHSASSTPRALGTPLWKHHSLDSTYCT